MGKIKLMPDHLANKIAAGEVVERPASVIKELVENSIDANSKSIKVELLEAGLQQIKITDDGDGMAEEDCEHAFFRHATSKIQNENDLFHVRTLGFRGEALASIAAVSRLSIQTSTGNEAGTRLELEGGKLTNKSKSDARKGTEIIVNDIFFNTPARLKYMKTIHTELGHITDVLNRMALAHPEVKFSCSHNGKQLFHTSGRGDLLQVIAQIYGMGTARKMVPVVGETKDFKVSGYIAKPEVTRASRNYISTIINGRYIRNITLNKAVMQGYHTLLPIGRNPLVVLNVEMDPILVDVNVHPAKLEVRFSKEQELFELVKTTIQSTFRKETLIPEAPEQKKPVKKIHTTQPAFHFYEEREQDAHEQRKKSMDHLLDTPSYQTDEKREVDDHEQNHYQEKQNEVIKEMVKEDPKEATVVQEKTDAERVPAMYPIGQLHGTYILAQNEQGLYIVDQHAAQERIKYEFYTEKLGEVENEVQELLVPLTFDFSKQEALRIEEYHEELMQVGIFFEAFGENSYIIRSHPIWFPKGFEVEVIEEMVEQIMSEERINIKKIREDAATLMSCKRSIKANHYLNHNDMFQLLEDLRKSTDPFTCPHGRPIIVHFSEYEMEKMFKRVM
ncbi:DNA mismatch repair protein MutL [Thalassobacillus devorans]|uniref:DNA mismatch repair protein MutL n=1 Tax=Thalassobacillus devorans TaxID=279813 RepID=A0ABQ1P2C3_9BACI|nr:DNA mismatch repair endonuclease MutL [Thalassobacillus devorans]NIK27994.1 DNA mismatch repair protein MutL [Thalassobacillus devorans]GGC89765.1 DNA mismatch repair protein MutL [Thalassobacillus devorans]